VIHPISRDAAVESIRVVHAAGVRGVFLIDQGMDERGVLRLVLDARERLPSLWVGVNLLGRRPADALRTALEACEGRIDGLWCDNAGIDERATSQTYADELVLARRRTSWTGLYFGGVAFKYQREIAASDLSRAAALAAPYMDVICTSGPGTGKAAEVDKLRVMREAVGSETAIALASGVTADNVEAYLPHVDSFLVGTGIEERLGVIDAAKVSALHYAIDRSA
jgi:uncharacterized protein